MRRPVLLSRISLLLSLTLALAGGLAATSAAPVPETGSGDETLLLRFPDIHRDSVAFVYAGDIWIAPAAGGAARRLTSHEGLELFPKFSPDGRWIAFSGEYSGTRQVYVISVEGGTPRQLTYYNDVGPMPPRGGFDYRILGWTNDGDNVLFRANRLPWGVRMGRYYTVPVDGGLETPLAIPEGGGGDLSPDGTQMVYTPIDREFRTWKRYRGGRAQDVWIYDLENDTTEQITTFEGTDNQPVWVDDTIYFASDRDRNSKLNLYAYAPSGEQIRQLTFHDEYDVLWPSGGPEAVVYENGGRIHRYDPATGKSQAISIRVTGDLPHTYPRVRNVEGQIASFGMSPTGARVLLGARGDLFTVPAEHGSIRNLTRTQGVREIFPTWSPDGQWIAYYSDASDEYELYVRRRDGSGEARRVTRNGDIWRFPPLWSPDGKKLAYGDKKQRLRYVDVDSGRVTDVDDSDRNDITTYTWSPDSQWLAYTKVAPNRMNVIWLFSLAQKKAFQLTDELVSNFSPVFDPDGKYLYFLSNRDFNLAFSGFEFNYLYTSPTRLYVGTLNDDIPMPLAPKSDDEPDEPADGNDDNGDGEPEGENGGEEDEGGSDEDLKIQVAGFDNRVISIPGPPGTYAGLRATKKGPLYLFRQPVPGGQGPPPPFALRLFDMKEEEEKTILEGINTYSLSGDEKKVLYRTRDGFGIVDAKPEQKNTDGMLSLAALEMKIDPRKEWAQIYSDGWRVLRDWFYDPDLHGVDWDRIRERYGRLVPHVAHRYDLDYLLGEVGGELNAGHIYVQAGDTPQVERTDGGLLGAELVVDDSGYYRIAKIFPGENWHPNFRSPLTEPGVDVQEGDFLLAIDGQEVTTEDNPYRFLEHAANRQVTLTVNDRPDTDGARDERVRPVARETNLRYLDWVLERRRRVEEASGGRIGYIHMPNTAGQGNRELFKYFYPQVDKDALIIDVRYNGGGFIPDRMIELLDRPTLNYWARRGMVPGPTPVFSHTGPKACLLNGYSSSGGDAFPYYFRKRGLGPLIGTRTWGGLIGISGNPGLADGGTVLASTFRFMDTDGNWAVENIGVSPDIEVLDRADQVVAGRDPSLEKAIEVLMKELADSPPQEIEWPQPWVDKH